MATSAEVGNLINQSYDELSNYQATKKNPLTLLNEAQSQLGIPEVRTRVSSLRKSLLDTENLLAGVEGSVKGRTSGSLVTEAQRQRLTAQEREPIAGQLNKTQGMYGMETANMADLMGQASTQAGAAERGQTMGEESIRTRLQKYQDEWTRLKKAEDEAAAERIRQENLRYERSQSRSSGGSGGSGGGSQKLLDSLISDITSVDPNRYVDSMTFKAPSNREAFIRELAKKYKGKIDTKVIADQVYSRIRGYREAKYQGLPTNWKL